jgi:hypothetical protein
VGVGMFAILSGAFLVVLGLDRHRGVGASREGAASPTEPCCAAPSGIEPWGSLRDMDLRRARSVQLTIPGSRDQATWDEGVPLPCHVAERRSESMETLLMLFRDTERPADQRLALATTIVALLRAEPPDTPCGWLEDARIEFEQIWCTDSLRVTWEGELESSDLGAPVPCREGAEEDQPW